MKLLTCVTMLLLAAPSSAAQPARDMLVVSAAWLQQHVNDPNLVLLHVGNKETYDAGHLPGARYVDYRSTLAAVEGANGLTLEMLPADVLHDRLAALGLSDTSRVVVYQSDEMWTPSTRVIDRKSVV